MGTICKSSTSSKHKDAVAMNHKKMSKYCQYLGCRNTKSAQLGVTKLSYFTIPSDARLKIWEKHIGSSDMSRRSVVCEEHFYESDMKFYGLKKMLNKTAVPKSVVKCGCNENGMSENCTKILNLAGSSEKENVTRKQDNQQGKKQQAKLQKMALTGDYIPLSGSPIVIPSTPSPQVGPSFSAKRKRTQELKLAGDEPQAKVQKTTNKPHTVVSSEATASPKKSVNVEQVGECDSTTQNEGEKEILMNLLKKEEVDPLDCSDVVEVVSYTNIIPSTMPPDELVEVIPVLDVDESNDEESSVIEIPDGPVDDSVIFVKEQKPTESPKVIKLTPISKSKIRQLKLKKKSLEANKNVRTPTTSTNQRNSIISLDTPTTSKSLPITPGKIKVVKQNTSTKSGENKPKFVVLDGSNIAFHHSIMKKVFSVEGLKIAIDYFENKGHECVAVVPMFRAKGKFSTNPNLLKELNLLGKVIFSPSKNINGFSLSSYDDLLIMQVAEANQGVIISNDNFADLLGQNIAWDTIIGTRVVGFTWFKDQFFLPLDPYGRDGPKINDILYC